MTADQVADALTGNVFVRLAGFMPYAETYVKLEGLNPAGSIKLKTARELLDSAEDAGDVGVDTELIESTSGNLGVALATICAARGRRLTLVTDPNANVNSIRQMRALGATVVVVQDRDAAGGYLNTRIDFIRRRLRENPKLHWLNQYANRANIRAHRDHTAREIVESFGLPDWLFVGVGTSGTLMGCVEYFRSIAAGTVVVAVDAVGSVTFGGPAGVRHIPGIGASRRPELFDAGPTVVRMLVDERDTVRTCRAVARRHGLLLGGSSGTALAAVRAMRGRIRPGERALVIAPDMGDRYLDTIYDDDWVVATYGRSALAEPPASLLACGTAAD